MAIAVPRGPSMAINGPSMGIDEVFLTMIPSMGIEIFDHKIRSTWPCSKFQQNSRHSRFSVYLSFVWDFENAQIFYSEMKLYIVIHIIYLCEKPDSGDFPMKKHQIFLIQKRILRVKFLHISDIFSSYKQMVFSAIEARFRRIFMRKIAILPGFSFFSNNSRARLRNK